ncbi:hypothetical protein H4219_004922 [Mycoemilia scoparia]|uniref:Sulfhydryl oxidase n=1 Tax=Mycoemilia scoparia TaxID=417184 RepID=A0A9W7ZZJ9_9FUNG|nr:hypothetical protein H4219_004922 [Mycoemilia scoparia]
MAAAFNNKVMEAREMNWRDLIPKNPLFGNGNGSEDPNVMPEFLLDDSENGVVMGKMPNETLKAQLGQSTWYFLHVMASRYPVDPTRNEQDTMRFFLRGLSRLYPCGQCAHHIQQHFKKDPPRVGSRDELEQYLCNFHNEVNKRLKKPLFDCKTVHDHYDCGCGPDLVRYKPEEDEKDS